jgi:hypothetical protein
VVIDSNRAIAVFEVRRGLPPTDERDNLQPVSFRQAALGVAFAGDDGQVPLDRQEPWLQLQPLDQLGQRGPFGDRAGLAIDDNLHAEPSS